LSSRGIEWRRPVHVKQAKCSAVVLSILVLGAAASCSNQPATLSFVQPTAYSSAQIADYFPLATGAYWLYQGTVKWTRPNSTPVEVVEQKIQWKMEVTRKVEDNDIVGYEMKGAPWDLAWYEAGQAPSEYSIIRVGTNRFYTADINTTIRLFNADDILIDLVRPGDLLLEIPLVPGERFCDDISITRPDGMYCWTVAKVSQVDLNDVKGISSSVSLDEYSIFQVTMPDSSGFTFVPGIGITSYTYRHHGTISECDLKLIEFHPGP
jgi:hypothetical protein